MPQVRLHGAQIPCTDITQSELQKVVNLFDEDGK